VHFFTKELAEITFEMQTPATAAHRQNFIGLYSIVTLL
jgi:hypothetical protein